MGGSRFSGKRTIKLPPVCHKELYDLPPPYVANLPTSLSALAIWFEGAFGWTIAESFRLVEDPSIPGWFGCSGIIGLNVAVTVERMPTPLLYDILLEVRQDEVTSDDDSWHGIEIPDGPPYDSGLLTHLWGWPTDYTRVRITD